VVIIEHLLVFFQVGVVRIVLGEDEVDLGVELAEVLMKRVPPRCLVVETTQSFSIGD
jgi:hypothetical protein